MPGYVVAAGYVTVETAVPGGRAAIDIPRGQALPDDAPAETVARLLGLGDIAPLGEPELDPVPEPDEVPNGTVADVLAWVGEDVDRARQALGIELTRGDQARKGVMEPLGDLLAAAQG